MLQLNPKGPDLFDSFLPDELKKLPEELEQVNQLLTVPEIMEPFVKRFSETMGRPTIPIYTYLRLMYLKTRYKLGYETLVQEVSDSIAWRRFCGIPYNEKVPDDSTLIKLTHKYGEETLSELHRIIVTELVKRKVVRGRKIRVDTTVISSNIHYPTDTSLLGDGLKQIRSIVKKVQVTGLRIGRTLSKVKKFTFSASQLLRKADKKSREKVRKINRIIIDKVRKTINKVQAVVNKVHNIRVKNKLEQVLHITKEVARQSEERLNGIKPTDRIVSITDPEARPIVKGKLDKPVEFGRIVQITQDESGIITQHEVFNGNPCETGLVPGILKTHRKQFPGKLKEIAADTGFASEQNSKLLKKAKVLHIGIPARGKPPPEIRRIQNTVWFHKLRRFRAGIEAIISFLNRKFGFKRSMYRGTTGAKNWVSWVIITANLYRLSFSP